MRCEVRWTIYYEGRLWAGAGRVCGYVHPMCVCVDSERVQCVECGVWRGRLVSASRGGACAVIRCPCLRDPRRRCVRVCAV